MSKVTWMYNRKGCKSCAESHAFLDANEVEIESIIDCRKEPKTGSNAVSVLTNAKKLYSVKGKKINIVDLKENRPDEDELKKLLLGPTGNLRAPTICVDETVIVGYNSKAYEEILVG